MANVKSFLTNWWTVSLVVLVVLLVLFCLGLPIVVVLFRPWWVRLLLFVVLAGGWGLLAYLRVRKARKAVRALTEGIGGGGEPADSEQRVQAQRMTEALAGLKQATGNRRDYLYSRPWYVIIGPPGSGKTTALLNSGLRFPFSNQSLKGTGGTRNLDFWFADEAVLIDTAGRYTSQDSDAAADGKAWSSFLALLKRHRPLQPVNGIIVAIGADELLRGDRLAIDVHAGAIRRRLAEIRSGLEVAAPVYVLVTKTDLLAGFSEFFDDLDVEGRRAVLGHTFHHGDGRPKAETIIAAFDEVAQTINDRQAKRLAEEPDAQRRSLIMGFPAQMTTLRARLARLLDGAFGAANEPGAVLRGIYFTSGVQQGAPLDRLLSSMAEVYHQPRTDMQGNGRAYFLNRLLLEVMFPEAGLVQMDPKARLRLRTRLTAAIGGIAALSLLILVLWGVSFFRNRDFQSTLLAQAQTAQATIKERGIDMVQVSGQDADLEQALAALDQLRGLAQGYADDKAGGPPLTMRFGLFESGLSEKAIADYREGLRRILLPRLLLRLEGSMQENISNPLAVYEPLKVYLMLGGQKPGGPDRAAVKSWVTNDWAMVSYPGADRADLRKRLGQHLDALLEDKDMASVWPDRRAPLDGTIIMAARTAVQTMSVADRAYAILRQKAMAQQGQPWSASTVLSSGDAQAFANGAAVLQLQVPYLFTRGGYEKAYQPGLLTVQKDLEDDLWVLGSDANTTMIREQISGVRPGVAALYSKEYIAAWENVVNAMQPAQYFSDLAAFGTFTKTPSPWKLLLLELRKNTTFEGGSGAAKSMIADRIKSRLGEASGLVPTSGAGIDAGQAISAYFKPIHDYVGNGQAPAPIDDFVAAVKTAGQAVLAARSAGAGAAGDAVQAQMATATAAVAGAGASAPPMLQSFVGATSKGGSSAQSSAVQGAVSEGYANLVMPACREVTQDKYPFFAAATEDASVAEAVRFFGNGGVMDGFVRDRLMPLLDTAGAVWRWRLDDPVASALTPSSADEFSRTVEIRDLLTAGLTYKVSVQSFSAGVDAAEFSSGGNSYRFAGANAPARPMLWSPQAGVPEAHVTMFKGAQQLDKVEEEGPWAVFRLMEKARKQNSGETAFLATFGTGDKSVTFRIELSSPKNPFRRGGVWAFRCPAAL